MVDIDYGSYGSLSDGISNAYTLDIVLILVIYTVGELLEYKKRSLTFKFAVLWPNHMVFFAPYLVR